MKHQSNILALKYRPSNFQDLIGQEYLVETIQKSIEQNKIPNAYIFTGIRGVGKTTTARIVAKMLNCTVFDKNNKPDLTNCEQAKAITEDRHPDVIEIDAASNTSVENAREIIENVKYNPVLGKYKVYIVDEVHMLSKSAFNALLKTLEEPPPHSKFIFATTEISKVPITILSRCQRFDLRRVDKKTLYNFLINISKKEDISISNDALNIIVKASDGSVRDSLSILDQANIFKSQKEIQVEEIVNMLGFAKQSDLYELTKFVLDNDLSKLISMLDEMYQRGSEITKVIEDLMNIINWSCKLKINTKLLNDEFLTEEDKNFASYVLQFDQGKLNIFWQSLMKGYDEIKISPQPHTTLEMVLLRCAFLLHDNQQIDSEEKKKPEINQNTNPASPNLDQVIQNKVNQVSNLPLKDKIDLHQHFFQFYGKNFSPLMAGIIIENCEIVEFSEENKILRINVIDKNFNGGEELYRNLKNEYTLEVIVKKEIVTLEEIKSLYKKELIDQEMETEEFKKVLAKFPNAKIIDIEEIERGDDNDG
ncbi:DNA polymerase III subunit gamma/tau [Alphaproteobacteria bacterium]|nr:DNA polymerase III subunit gamma/tau [Alphaproteobacteria bacterium]